MAFIEQNPEDELDNPEQSRESGVISGSGLAARPSNRPSKTGYVNVQDYVEANKPGIEQFARDIGSGVSGAVTGSQRGTGQLLESFKGAQAPDIDYGQLGTYLTQEGLQEGEKDLVSRALASGQAPKQLTDMPEYQKALKEHQQAMEMLKLSQGGTSELGELARKVVKPQQYSRGMQGLDASLLAAQKDFPTAMVAAGGGSKDPNAPASDKFVGSGQDYFERATKEAGDIGKALGEKQAKGLGLLKEAAGKRWGGLEQQLQGQQKTAQEKFAADETAILDAYLKELAAPYGGVDVLGARGVDVAPFYNKTALPERHWSQFANQGQVDEYDVLRRLIEPGYDLSTGGYGDIAPQLGLDKSAYQQAVIDNFLKNLSFPEYQKPVPLSSQDLETQVAADWRRQTKSMPGLGEFGAKKAEQKKKEREYEQKARERVGNVKKIGRGLG